MSLINAEVSKKGTNLSRSIYLASAVIGCLFVASIALVVHSATIQANTFSKQSEKHMVELEMERIVESTINAQQEISYWDKSIEKLIKDPTKSNRFVRDEIRDWLVSDLGFENVALVRPDNTIQFSVAGKKMAQDLSSLPLVDQNIDLIDAARKKFFEEAIVVQDKYFIKEPIVAIVPAIQAHAWRMIDNKPNLVIAQVIIPVSARLALQDSEITVMVSTRSFNAEQLNLLGKRLDVMDLQFRDGVQDRLSLPLIGSNIEDKLELSWIPKNPRSAIIQQILPFVLTICLFLCGILGFIVKRQISTLQALSESEAKNRFLANHDSMTRLANRQFFDQALNKAFDRLNTKEFAVLCIDFDKFKAINDNFGHPAGDAVLKAVAKRFQEKVKNMGIVARIGGDEFVALIHDYESRDEVKWLADQLIEEARQPVLFGSESLQISASIGIAYAPRDGENARVLFQAADEALYRSKTDGRDRVSDFSEIAGAKEKAA